MPTTNRIYKISVSSDYIQWWRYNIFLTVVGYDPDGKITSYDSTSDKTYEIGGDASQRIAPAGSQKHRTVEVSSKPCHRAEIYLYIIANTFPESTEIKDSPPFKIALTTMSDDKTIGTTEYDVNQWGGLTLAGLAIDSDKR